MEPFFAENVVLKSTKTQEITRGVGYWVKYFRPCVMKSSFYIADPKDVVNVRRFCTCPRTFRSPSEHRFQTTTWLVNNFDLQLEKKNHNLSYVNFEQRNYFFSVGKWMHENLITTLTFFQTFLSNLRPHLKHQRSKLSSKYKVLPPLRPQNGINPAWRYCGLHLRVKSFKVWIPDSNKARKRA